MGLGLDGGGVEGVERGGGRAGSSQEDAGRCRRGQQALRPTVHRFRPTFSPLFRTIIMFINVFPRIFIWGCLWRDDATRVSV